MATKLTWNTHDDLYHSDHFPIIIQFTAQHSNHSYQKYNLKKADWDEFTALTEIKEVTDNSILEAIYNKIQAAVNQTIPKITINNSNKKVPWWTTDIAKLIKSRKKCMRKYKKTKLLADFEAYKKVRSETRKNILEQKTKSWNEFLQKINSYTSATEIWNNINRIKNGITTRQSINSLRINNVLITDNKELADSFAQYFHDISSDKNYDNHFLDIKRNEEQALPFQTGEKLDYNKPFTNIEYIDAVRNIKRSTAGPDNISMEMIENLHETMKDLLLILSITKSGVQVKYQRNGKKRI